MMKKLRLAATFLLASLFLLSGCYHFLNPAYYLRMMPAYLPWHPLLVRISGLAELGLGLLLPIPGTKQKAGWGLIALLAAIFPANLEMALHPDRFPEFNPTALWMRLPMQFALMALVHWCTRASRHPASTRP